ncbi:hypothetical protein G195_003534 [Phytophthora kernoviae 00238/432]|uniref:Protein translocase subunit SecA n=1 Tax=Phytophthora kernoviae 00238/432 TaxID=1284355 RepID=A0A8J4SIT5_9STRA|nr:hypothetical protein G195_003534 [Phytophthora kernoviae 00238/432]
MNERDVKRLMKTVDVINKLEPQLQALSDDQLKAKTDEFRARIEKGETTDELLPEAFATVREASRRVLGKRHYDVQMLGGIALHEGRISEMKTGEGKTLVGTLPVYLNALTSKGVHVVTVNDYLAQRDSQEMGQIYEFMGMTVGVNLSGMDHALKQHAYACDITYGTNNEFGFDYLRDNMVLYKEQMVQRPLFFCIIDEVDSILVDEARTPLIISGQAQKSTDMYYAADRFVKRLVPEEDFTVDIKVKSVALTEAGVAKAEKAFGIENLYDHANVTLNHHIVQGLKANVIMRRDVDYVVSDEEVLIVDEFTGRLMAGRRYSDGLHQAIEAKEGIEVQNESMTLATITFQNYFRMYRKLAGMTGTAKTEEEEFKKIYGLEVLQIPTNRPNKRDDMADVVYKSIDGKFKAVVEEIVERHSKNQPVLVGTVSIENSERLSDMLKRRGIRHQVLNAKYHAEEAEIISGAGQAGAVTIATNMAGRGTDIILGEGVAEVGGLHIIGTERHESRRIDNQLRGRAGRQGDPGSTQFYLSLGDELMKRFGADNVLNMMERLGFEEDQPIESRMITRAVESAQKRVEGNNFDVRKVVLQYDDVMNQQREIIYKQRREVLESENIKQIVMDMIKPSIERIVEAHCSDDIPENWELQEVADYMNSKLLDEGSVTKDDLWGKEAEEIIDYLFEKVQNKYNAREERIGEEMVREFEKVVVLRAVDSKWMDHIDAMDQLRQGIHLRAYGGTDPLREYQFEGFEMFHQMIASIQEEVATYVMRAQIESNQERQAVVDESQISTSGEPTEKHLKQEMIENFEVKMSAPDFWDDNDKAQALIAELNAVKGSVDQYTKLQQDYDDAVMMAELADEEGDDDLAVEIGNSVTAIVSKVEEFELQLLLNQPYDKMNAILELHPGAGGTESQDWGQMLMRMYTRWAEKRGFKVEVLDYLAGDEAGIKSVTLSIKGHNAYGYLKAEKGVHRLIDDTIELDIRTEDLKIDTYRASGAGGQHINTTDSAIKNRERAMTMLRSKLYERKIEEQKQHLDEIRGEQSDIAWGSQIRSYVFHPYSMVKDHLIIMAAFVLSLEQSLFALIGLYVTGKVIDAVEMGLGNSKVAYIISNQTEPITKVILDDLDRGLTKLEAKGGYTDDQRTVLMVVVGQNEVPRLKALIRSVDPGAFVIISNAHEVLGEGFKREEV